MPDLQQFDEEALIDALLRRGVDRSAIRLDEDTENELVLRVMRDFMDAVGQNQVFRNNHLEFLRAWRGLTSPKNFPFEGASNIRVPFTSAAVEQTKARVLRGLLGDPGSMIGMFSAQAENVDPHALDDINESFQWELEETVGIRAVMRDVLHFLCIDGFSVPIPNYEHCEREVRYTMTFELLDNAPLAAQLEMLLKGSVFEGKTVNILEQPDAGVFNVTVLGGDRIERPATVTFSITESSICAVVETTEVTFDGVTVDIPSNEDIVIINSAPEVERLPFFGARQWITLTEYKDGVADGTYRNFNSDDIKRVEASATTKQSEYVPQEITDQLDAVEGGQSKDHTATYLIQTRAWLEVYRWEGRFKLGTSPRSKEVDLVAWILPRARRVIRIMRLDEINRQGERTPIKFEFIRQPGRFYPISLVEWLRHVQAELDAIHCQRLDSGLVSMVPFFFYTPTAGFEKQILQLEPGKGYPIRDPQGVVFPKVPWNPTWSFQEEGLVRKYAQEQAGLSEAALGTFITKRASASEWTGTANALDLRTDLLMEGIIESTRALLMRIFELNRKHMPDGRVYQVSNLSGERVVKTLQRSRLQTAVVLHLTANSQQIAQQTSRDIAVNMLSLMLNPLMMQMGIVGPDTIFKALEKVAKAMGYKGVPFHSPDVPPMSDPPDVEHKRMTLGEQVEPSPVENFSAHLTAHMRLASQPNLTALMTPMALMELQRHIQQTIQLQQQVMAIRAMQAASAGEMQSQMGSMGIDPTGAGGSQPGNQAAPATADEGNMGGAPTESQTGLQ